MEKLLADTGGGSLVDCHQESYRGTLAYKIYETAFQDGNSSCHSGYYHGHEQLLKEKGTANLPKVINEVCETFPTQFGKFECLHGAGHGVMAYDDYDLPKALTTCQLLKDSYSVSSCYGGVFMEHIVTAQGSGGSKDHETKWATRDPHFPCNEIDLNFEIQYQCYQMQTSWMLSLHDYDFNKVAQDCFQARPDMVDVCFKSFGRDAAGHTLRDPFKSRPVRQNSGRSKVLLHLRCRSHQCNRGFWGDQLKTLRPPNCRFPKTGNVPATLSCQPLLTSSTAKNGVRLSATLLKRIIKTYVKPISNLAAWGKRMNSDCPNR